MTQNSDVAYRFYVHFRETNRVAIKDAFSMPVTVDISERSLNRDIDKYRWLPRTERNGLLRQWEAVWIFANDFWTVQRTNNQKIIVITSLFNLDGGVACGDDIAVFSNAVDGHVSRLTNVLEKIKMIGSKLSCSWKIACLEVVRGGKTTPLPEKTVTIRDFPNPMWKQHSWPFRPWWAIKTRAPNFATKRQGLFELIG